MNQLVNTKVNSVVLASNYAARIRGRHVGMKTWHIYKKLSHKGLIGIFIYSALMPHSLRRLDFLAVHLSQIELLELGPWSLDF